MMRWFAIKRIIFLACAAIGFGTIARAGSPPYVPVQAVLTDASGLALDGDIDLVFHLYASASGGAALWTESQSVRVERGLLTAHLGAGSGGLDLSLFRQHEELWLGIQVGLDPEMSRLRLGTAPFSAFAQYSSHLAGDGILISSDNVISSSLGSSIESAEIADRTIQLEDLAQNGCSTDQIIKWNGTAWICAAESAVPSGAVMSFNRGSCPPGWHPLAAAQGRVIVGLPASGTLLASYGAPLADQEARSITGVPAHTHAIDPPATASGAAADHGHGLTDPGHGHGLPRYIADGGPNTHCMWPTGAVTTEYAAWSTANRTTGVSVQAAGAHGHAVDVASFTSASAGSAAVDVSMPYIQLLACEKD